MHNELKNIEGNFYSLILSTVLSVVWRQKKTTKLFIHDSLCPRVYSNLTISEYKSRTLSLELTCSVVSGTILFTVTMITALHNLDALWVNEKLQLLYMFTNVQNSVCVPRDVAVGSSYTAMFELQRAS